jgi:ATP-binding cassette subfamily E protein 1
MLQDVEEELPTFNVSYKPQKISPKFEGSVRQLLHKKIRDSYLHPQVRPVAGLHRQHDAPP